jgi:hypothetical protein
VHNQQQQQVSAHQSTTTTTTRCECCAQDATADSTTSSAYNYVLASFFGLSSFLLYKNFFCINKISFLYIKVALKVNIIRR